MDCTSCKAQGLRRIDRHLVVGASGIVDAWTSFAGVVGAVGCEWRVV